MTLVRQVHMVKRLSSGILPNLTTAEETRSELLIAMSIPSESILGLMFANAGDLGAAEERFSFDSLQDALAEATNAAEPFARDSSNPTFSRLSGTTARGSVDAGMVSRIFRLMLIEPGLRSCNPAVYSARLSRGASEST
jgi:hypothetical protein